MAWEWSALHGPKIKSNQYTYIVDSTRFSLFSFAYMIYFNCAAFHQEIAFRKIFTSARERERGIEKENKVNVRRVDTGDSSLEFCETVLTFAMHFEGNIL